MGPITQRVSTLVTMACADSRTFSAVQDCTTSDVKCQIQVCERISMAVAYDSTVCDDDMQGPACAPKHNPGFGVTATLLLFLAG